MAPEHALKALMPIRRERVYDLVREVGMDVSDWSNYKKGDRAPAANSRYCYEWCFTEGEQHVVLNLWYASLVAQNDRLVCELNMRAYANEIARAKDEPWRDKKPKPVWERRAQKMDSAIQLANRKKLPIRVIVCEGTMRDAAAGDEKASNVKKRMLDPSPWFVDSYDIDTGQTSLMRGDAPQATIASVIDTSVEGDDEPVIPSQAPQDVADLGVHLHRAAKRMVETAIKTVAQANGQVVESSAKVKENHFPTVEAFQAYVAGLLKAQGGRCALSSLSLQLDGQETDRQMLASLDRIDSAGHYAPGNLQVVCQFINRWKGADDNAEFVRLLQLLRL